MLKNCLLILLCVSYAQGWAALPGPTATFPTSQNLFVNADAIQMDGALVNGRVSIHWVTDADTASGFFIVQKSVDGKSWQECQRMGATGKHDYRTTDEGLSAGNCWYRIVLINATGFEITSAPLWLSGTKKLVSITLVRSNQTLSLVWWGTGPVTADVQLFAFSGQPTKNYGAVSFTNSVSLPLTDLAPGRYILKFVAGPVVESLSFQY